MVATETAAWEPNSFLCSSLVAAAYQAIGLMQRPPIGPLPNNILPGDFSQTGSLPFLKGCSLGEEIMLRDRQ